MNDFRINFECEFCKKNISLVQGFTYGVSRYRSYSVLCINCNIRYILSPIKVLIEKQFEHNDFIIKINLENNPNTNTFIGNNLNIIIKGNLNITPQNYIKIYNNYYDTAILQ